jgi:hypothetical protein
MFSDLGISASKREMAARGKKTRRLFRYAMVRDHTRNHAVMRDGRPIIAEYSTAFSVAYTGLRFPAVASCRSPAWMLANHGSEARQDQKSKCILPQMGAPSRIGWPRPMIQFCASPVC